MKPSIRVHYAQLGDYPFSDTAGKTVQREVFFRTIGELDELRELARGTELEITQLDAGTMQGVLSHVELSSMSLHRNSFNLSARGRGTMTSEHWTFVLFMPGVCGRFNAFDLSEDIILAYPPGTDFDGFIPGAFQDWIITVPGESLEAACESIHHLQFKTSAKSVSAIHLPTCKVQKIRQLVANAMALANSGNDVCFKPYEDRLLESLAAALSFPVRDDSTSDRTYASRWGLIRQIEDLTLSDDFDPFSIQDLCRVTKTNERTLRRIFLDVLGMPPHQYLRNLRLNRARAELETADAAACVTTVAMKWGFSHLGRFSQEYKSMFQELPSQTLQRSREFPPR